jgi:C4-dicarboxylate transporter DctM subunit
MYIMGGCFMDALALITLTVAIIYPVVMILGFDTFLPSFARY